MNKEAYEKPILLPVERFRKGKVLIFQGFRARKRAILKVDDQSIVPVKNEVLTGNKMAGVLRKKKVYIFLSL